MNLYEILDFNYDGTEPKDTDEKLREIYDKKTEEYKKIINTIYEEYDFPKDYRLLINLDIAEIVRKKYGEIDISKEKLDDLSKKYETVEKARIKLIEYIEKFINIKKAYSKVKTVDLRLIYACECEKNKSVCESDIVGKIEYIPEMANEKTKEKSGIERIGKLEYKNWTGAYVGYIIRYKVKDEDGNEQFVFSEISEEDLNNPKYIDFINRTILNKEYIKYAIENNGGYLGVPKVIENGEYIIGFDTEEIVAARKYQEQIEKSINKKENDEKEKLEEDLVL